MLEASHDDNDPGSFGDNGGGSSNFIVDPSSFSDNGGGSSSFVDDILAGNNEYIDSEFLMIKSGVMMMTVGWDDLDMEAEIKLHQRLKNLDLVWKDDNQLEKNETRTI